MAYIGGTMDLEQFEAEQERLKEQRSKLAAHARSESEAASIRIVDRRSRPQAASDLSRAIDKTKRQIAEARSGREQQFARNAKVLQILTTALHKRGQFFHDDVQSYFFLADSQLLLRIERDEVGVQLLLRQYGLLPNDFITNQVIEDLKLEAHGRGRATATHAFSAYERSSQRVYVCDFEGGVYRLSAGAIEHVDNGTDGMLFPQNSRWKSLGLSSIGGDFDWRAWLLDGIRFSDGALSDADQKLLTAVWVLSLFFPQLFPTRIILSLRGEKGSGKTSLPRRLGKVLFGPNFDVAVLTQKPDDFDAAVTSHPLVVADNADTAPRWFPDKLAVVATGGTLKRRLLYTTNRLGEFPIKANVAVTSRTPNFGREDVAERLLPLTVERIESFVPESKLLHDDQMQRTQIIAAILGDVHKALRELTKTESETFRTQLRMADFADFALKIAPVFCERDEMRRVLNRMSGQQVDFASEDDPLLDLIDRWLEDDSQHNNFYRDVPPGVLAEELERLAGSRSVLWERGNSRSFGQYLRNRKGTLKRLYGMSERTIHGGTSLLTFVHKRGDFGELAGRAIPDLRGFCQDPLETE